MGPSDILTACIVGLILSPVLALAFWALYLMTEGVEGIGRRLYAMLLVLLSAVGVGLVTAVLMAAFWALALAVGVAVAAAIGVPVAVLFGALARCAGALAAAGPRQPSPKGRDSWLGKYLEWIKRVAQGDKNPVGEAKGKEEATDMYSDQMTC